MKTKLLATLILITLLTGILAVIPIRPVAAIGTLSITPSPVNKDPIDKDSFFDVYVDISTDDLYGFDIKITWDNTLIIFSSLVGGHTYLDAVWTGFFEPLVVPPVPGPDLPPYQTGPGYVRYAAVSTGGAGGGHSGAARLFKITFQIVKACNFQLSTLIHFDTVKLSDSQWNSIDVTKNDGTYSMSATVPDIDFVLINPHPSKPYEYCKYFEVEVYATDICAQLTDYDLKINFDSELVAFVDVDYWGVFGTGTVSSTTGSVHVSGAGAPHTGSSLLLFTLTFHIEFDQRIEHIWRTSSTYPHKLTAQVSLDKNFGDLSFSEGTILVSGVITTSTSVTIDINLIQGDVSCDGHVNIVDLRAVAAYYDQSYDKYDLKTDGTIDIFDLVVVAQNFMYYKPDTKPPP